MGFLSRIFGDNSKTYRDRLMRAYRKNIQEFINDCYDENTLEFDWELYYRLADVYCPNKDVVDYLESQLRDVGDSQIARVNLFIASMNAEEILAFLREKEANVIRNMSWVCGGSHEEKCPEYIVKHRSNLYDIMREKIPCTVENIEKILLEYNKGRRGE